MRRALVIGNWKMNGSQASNAVFLGELLGRLKASPATDVVLCPPLIYLESFAKRLSGTTVLLGSQNLCAESSDIGAFTGEVSGRMLAECCVRYVLVGHSERRQLYGESDSVVAEKFINAQNVGLIPVLCVGETLEEREAGRTLERIVNQLEFIVKAAGIDAFANAVVAYEPVWAIGTGRTASPEQAQMVHAYIREWFSGLDKAISVNLSLLYGGSVKASNANGLFVMDDIDGALVGGASLDAGEFLKIIGAVK